MFISEVEWESGRLWASLSDAADGPDEGFVQAEMSAQSRFKSSPDAIAEDAVREGSDTPEGIGSDGAGIRNRGGGRIGGCVRRTGWKRPLGWPR